MKQNIKKYKGSIYILSFILIFVTFFIIIVSSLFLYNVFILKRDLDGIYGFRFLMIAGDSMYPTLKPGDSILIKKTSKEDIVEGDIISFHRNSIIVTHRIVNIEGNNFITAGDNNNLKDKFKTNYSNILGKHIFTVEKGDKILTILKSPLVTIFIFLFILTTITYLFKSIFG
ncbi:signal peptidase I [Dethiothermospora halolimnae]|uniref:signal peptidase I n=1 Tax=Dethiothermospora halolimnae TaxID=3114390 RepID=UPI003CCB77DA